MPYKTVPTRRGNTCNFCDDDTEDDHDDDDDDHDHDHAHDHDHDHDHYHTTTTTKVHSRLELSGNKKQCKTSA